MEIKTDDEIHRVNSVWLGPPKATMPWHVRYVAWGIGLVVFFVVLSVQRAVGIGFGFFSLGWGFVITIVITRFIARMINYERPLGAVLALFVSEVSTPRERTVAEGGVPRTSRSMRVRAERPCPAVPGGSEPVEAGLDVLESGDEPEVVAEVPVRLRRRVSLRRWWVWLIGPLWAAGLAAGGALMWVAHLLCRAAIGMWLLIRRIPISRPRRVRRPFPHRGKPLPRRETPARRGPVIGQYKGGAE